MGRPSFWECDSIAITESRYPPGGLGVSHVDRIQRRNTDKAGAGRALHGSGRRSDFVCVAEVKPSRRMRLRRFLGGRRSRRWLDARRGRRRIREGRLHGRDKVVRRTGVGVRWATVATVQKRAVIVCASVTLRFNRWSAQKTDSTRFPVARFMGGSSEFAKSARHAVTQAERAFDQCDLTPQLALARRPLCEASSIAAMMRCSATASSKVGAVSVPWRRSRAIRAYTRATFPGTTSFG
jgi:hypothetical protein